MLFWKSDLLLWPCPSSKTVSPKNVSARGHSPQYAYDFLSDSAALQLLMGQELVFQCPKTKRGLPSPLVPSLDLYDGHLHKTPGFRTFISSLLEEGTPCFTISGGYGLVHPYEPIRKYNASMSWKCPACVWRDILPRVLADLVRRNGITRVFIACSEKYDSVLWSAGRNLIWRPYVDEVFRFVPRLRRGKGTNTNTANPELLGKTILELQDLRRPDSRWQHWINPERDV